MDLTGAINYFKVGDIQVGDLLVKDIALEDYQAPSPPAILLILEKRDGDDGRLYFTCWNIATGDFNDKRGWDNESYLHKKWFLIKPETTRPPQKSC